jgi:8-oxo-dGTP diphosphatase
MPSDVRVAVDVVVLALAAEDEGESLRMPLFLSARRGTEPFSGQAALPGSLMLPDEPLERAAERVLAAVGLDGGSVRHLEQLATFGRLDRDPRGRVVSVSYLALQPAPATSATPARWLPARDPPGLAFDHGEILATALRRLRGKLSYSTVAYGLLPDEFTLSELQGVYEGVLGRPVDKRNFRRKMLGLGVLSETGGQRRGPHRPAQLYCFIRHGLVVYDDLLGV